ncbi:hypothetical protein EDB84DRAFT_1591404 [Lactarius hengduanensis]|nr:hypothetical protein EDB84DRAFT_1591404 [Lactarius hengduanensis]
MTATTTVTNTRLTTKCIKSHVAHRLVSRLPPSPRRGKVPPRLHVVVTNKTRCHANPLPAIPVVTPPKHGVQDPATANAAYKSPPPTPTTMAARTTAARMMVTTLDTNDADETNTGDDTDNDDMRPATTMVTNARLATSWASARPCKGPRLCRLATRRPRLHPSPVHHYHPVTAQTRTDATLTRHARPTMTPTRPDATPNAVRRTHHDATRSLQAPPWRHPNTAWKTLSTHRDDTPTHRIPPHAEPRHHQLAATPPQHGAQNRVNAPRKSPRPLQCHRRASPIADDD